MEKRDLVSIVVILFIVSVTMTVSGFDTSREMLADVLIYNGAGAWDEGVVAFEKFLDFKGMTWYECDDVYIENNDLVGKFGAIHFPGGNSGYYIERINSVGLQNIRDFVDAGGGYIGICAGAYFACDRIIWEGNSYDIPLDLFDGVGYGAIDDIIPWPDYTMTIINMNMSNPINQFESSTEYVMYYGGAAFYPDESQEIDIIGTYDSFHDDAAIISFSYGDGRVLLFGPHPEIEEDSARDDVSFGDSLDDLGTDWNLLWTSMDWVMGWSISKPPDNLSPIIPKIFGPLGGKARIEYEYTFFTTDPELEEIYFYIEWGDGSVEEWIGPYASGEEVAVKHAWIFIGNYTIRAKAKDCNNAESDWGMLDVTKPRNNILFNSLSQWFFKRFPNAFPLLRYILQL